MKEKTKLMKSILDNIVLRKATPYIFIFEPSQLCNCKCSFCYHWKEHDKNELNKEEIFDILKQVHDLGCGLLVLNGGEPFIGPHFEDTVKKAHEIGYNINITTNGSLLSKKISNVAKYIDSITVSIDYPDERHDKDRKLEGLFKKSIGGIKEAQKYISDVKINYSIHKGNMNSIKDMIKLVKELKCQIYFRLLVRESKKESEVADYDLTINNEEDLKKITTELITLKKEGAPIVSSYPYLEYIRDKKRFECLISRFIINIDSHGRVYNACPEYEGTKESIFGSTRQQKIKDIWFGKKSEDFRKFSRKCNPNLNCYSACILEPSLVLKPDMRMWYGQFMSKFSIMKFFKK